MPLSFRIKTKTYTSEANAALKTFRALQDLNEVMETILQRG